MKPEKPLSEIKTFDHVPGFTSGKELAHIRTVLWDLACFSPPDATIMVLDLGTWKGRSAIAMADVLKDRNAQIWCVDHFKGSERERHLSHQQAEKSALSVYWEFMQYANHFGFLGTRIFPLTLDSEEAARYFDDDTFDFMFIDGDHDNLLTDLINWWPKLRYDGMIIGDDGDWKKVAEDVEWFAETYQTQLRFIDGLDGVLFEMAHFHE